MSMDKGTQTEWVGWSKYRDAQDRPMVLISGGDYPQPLALRIAHGILALLGADEHTGNRRLVKALKAIEWCGYAEGDTVFCPLCDQDKVNGHSPDCLVGMALEPCPEEKE